MVVNDLPYALSMLANRFRTWLDDGLETEPLPVGLPSRRTTTNYVLSDVEPQEVETRWPIELIQRMDQRDIG